MEINKYYNREVLYVTDSSNDEILIFGECSNKIGFKGMRSFETTAISNKPFLYNKKMNENNYEKGVDNINGAIHPYSITFDEEGSLYASFQHTDVIFRFEKNSFHTMKSPSNLIALYEENKKGKHIDLLNNRTKYDFFNGTFVQFGLPEIHNEEEQGLRSILWITRSSSSNPYHNPNPSGYEEELWVNNENFNCIMIFNHDAEVIGHIKIKNPISLFLYKKPSNYKNKNNDKSNDDIYETNDSNEVDGIVYVGSKDKKKAGGGHVYAIDVASRKIIKTYSVIGMTHPTGVTIYKDILYVGEQGMNVVLSFNITTTRLIKQIYKLNIYDPIEQIILSDC